MNDWQERVTEEKKALDEKIVKLQNFIASNAWTEVPTDSQELLGEQLGAMLKYTSILAKRIGGFNV